MPESQVITKLTKERAAINAQLTDVAKKEKELRKERADIDERLIRALDAINSTMVRNSGYSISISENEVPVIEDFSRLEQWIYRNRTLYLFERRISSKIFRETLDSRKGRRAIPGLGSFIKRTINFTKSKK